MAKETAMERLSLDYSHLKVKHSQLQTENKNLRNGMAQLRKDYAALAARMDNKK